MIRPAKFPFLALALALMAGCATAPAPVSPGVPPPARSAEAPPPEPAPAETAAPARPAPPVERPKTTVVPAQPVPVPPPRPTLPPEGSYKVRIESEPGGALILVDKVPVGRTPLEIDISGTAQGFCRSYLEIEARFLARGPAEVSSIRKVELTPLEKVPVLLRFTPTEVQRQIR